MTWGHPEGDLVRLHDGLLDEAAAQRVRAHLAGCAQCRELDHAIALTREALDSLTPVAPDNADRDRLRAALQSAKRGQAGLPVLHWAAAAAVVLLIGVAVWLYRPHVRFVDGPSRPRSIESAAIAEARLWSQGTGVVAQPFSSIETARRSVAKHTGVLPNLRPGNRQIIGTTDSTIGSVPISTLIYRIDSQPIALVVARAAALADPPPSLLSTKRLELRHDGDARIFTWSAGGDAYSLAVPKGVPAAKACAICHEGTRMMPLIEASTRRM